MQLILLRNLIYNSKQTNSQWYFSGKAIKFTLKVSNKKELTEKLVAQLPEGTGITVDDALKTWWYNLRANGGLRLSDRGFQILIEQLQLDSYKINIEDVRMDIPMFLAMNKKFKMPYYVDIRKQRARTLILFSSKEAMLVNMYGNLEKFLKSYG
jgi:hypothetical protein